MLHLASSIIAVTHEMNITTFSMSITLQLHIYNIIKSDSGSGMLITTGTLGTTIGSRVTLEAVIIGSAVTVTVFIIMLLIVASILFVARRKGHKLNNNIKDTTFKI